MRELVVISGKGGTGKTSLVASFAVLAERPVIADCDVDAANLHLVLRPTVTERHEFFSGHEAVIDPTACTGCAACFDHCRFGAVVPGVRLSAAAIFAVDPGACEGCGVCVRLCPERAIAFPQRHCGQWLVSTTRCGPLVHARLAIAAENSGKLVTAVRQEARRLAVAGEHPWLIVDGPPGIGCPVIAALTGASVVLIVAEPTVSGLHDLQRVLDLTRHFGLPAAVCVNKWDLNPVMTERVEDLARRGGADLAGRIRYDPAITLAQLREEAVVESGAVSADDIHQVWRRMSVWPQEAGRQAVAGREPSTHP
jgi:MinD superfamily P-loop ATPase